MSHRSPLSTSSPGAETRASAIMSLRAAARSSFLRLPPPVQRGALHALRRYAPWEPGFDHRGAEVVPGTEPGPPDFVGVGVQKAGTSWWYSLVTTHPDVYHHAGFHKERHFFDQLGLTGLAHEDLIAYQSWFPRPPGRMTGEWTPDYMYWHWVGPMLRAAAPQARLLVLLRDPIERFRSGLEHHRRLGYRLSAAIVAEAFERGLYSAQLSRLERCFSPRQILVLQYEACVDDPLGALRQTFSFLGLDDSFVPGDVTLPVNRSRREPPVLAGSLRSEAAEAYEDDLCHLARSHPEIDLCRWPTWTARNRKRRDR